MNHIHIAWVHKIKEWWFPFIYINTCHILNHLALILHISHKYNFSKHFASVMKQVSAEHPLYCPSIFIKCAILATAILIFIFPLLAWDHHHYCHPQMCWMGWTDTCQGLLHSSLSYYEHFCTPAPIFSDIFCVFSFTLSLYLVFLNEHLLFLFLMTSK